MTGTDNKKPPPFGEGFPIQLIGIVIAVPDGTG